jgi:hypothetical protein
MQRVFINVSDENVFQNPQIRRTHGFFPEQTTLVLVSKLVTTT